MTSQPLIRSKQKEKTINGISTQVVCTEFSNYIFVVLTQYGKIGTLISLTPDMTPNRMTSAVQYMSLQHIKTETTRSLKSKKMIDLGGEIGRAGTTLP